MLELTLLSLNKYALNNFWSVVKRNCASNTKSNENSEINEVKVNVEMKVLGMSLRLLDLQVSVTISQM